MGAARVWRAMAVAALAGLAACSSTGHSFNTQALSKIVPGHTTFVQAQALLEAAPADLYRHGDGSMVARWAHKSTLVADAVYVRRELLLRFDASGRFERVEDSVNVWGRPGAAEQPALQMARVPVQAPAEGNAPAPNPLADASARGIDNPAIVYPLAAP